MTPIHTIDAAGKTIGRVASEAAHVLMGKHVVAFARNKAGETSVTIKNSSKLSINEKKRLAKKYKTFSGYVGGLKEEGLEALAKRRGYREIMRLAVYGMLPGNKLRPLRMKRLIIEE